MGSTVKAFWGWLLNDALPFLFKNWKGTWLTISVAGLIATVMFEKSNAEIAAFLLSTVLAGITSADGWGAILVWFKALFMGTYGEDLAALAWALLCFLLGSIIFFVNPIRVVNIAARPVEAILFAAAILLIVATAILFVKNRITK